MIDILGSRVRRGLHLAGAGLLLLLLAGACGAEGIGGTGKPQREGSGMGGTGTPLLQNEGSGIGGTGNPAPHAEGSGIGGTGIPLADSEGSGIVGVITAFGSIWVNGVEVHYPADAVVDTPTGPRSADALALGQFVIISSDRHGNQATARDIQLLPAVAGPVTAVSPSGQRLSVAGQTVRLTGSVVQHAPTVGDWVSVYGMRRADGIIMATTIAPHPADGQVVVYGTAASGITEGTMRIQDLPLTLPPGTQVDPGTPVLVSGTLREGVLVAAQVRGSPIAAIAQYNPSLSIQGYVQAADAEQVTVDHLAIRLADTERPSQRPPDIDQLVLIEAHRADDGSFVADHIDALSLAEVGHDASEVAGMRAEMAVAPGRAADAPADTAGPSDSGTPEVQQPELEDPETQTSEVENPEFESPEIESPEVEAPEVEAPEVEAPEVEAPEVETPEVETPEVETPEVEVPEVEVPETESPEIEAPEVESPET